MRTILVNTGTELLLGDVQDAHLAFIAREMQRKFDAVMGGWHVDASPAGIRQTWGSGGAHPGGSRR